MLLLFNSAAESTFTINTNLLNLAESDRWI